MCKDAWVVVTPPLSPDRGEVRADLRLIWKLGRDGNFSDSGKDVPMQHKVRRFFLLLIGSLLLAPAAFATVTVTVSSPATGATVPTSLNFVASATTNAAGA